MQENSTNIASRVRQALSEDRRTQNAVIDVDFVQNSIVLSGTVGSFEVAKAAEQIAREQDGVNEVTNRLRY